MKYKPVHNMFIRLIVRQAMSQISLRKMQPITYNSALFGYPNIQLSIDGPQRFCIECVDAQADRSLGPAQF